MIDAIRPSVGDTGTLARAMSPPEIDREALKSRYDAILATQVPPFAFVDLDAMARNARRMLEQAGGLPIRIASKSVRSSAVLRRILDLDPGFRGVLAFTVPEALYLAEQGFEDLVVAYPSVDRRAIAQVGRLAAEDPARAPVLMVDDRPHLDLIEGAIGGGRASIRVCLDVDVGWWPLGGRMARIGPKRSPVHDAARARRMAEEIAERPGTSLAGLMAYEGQIAGVGDRLPGKPLRSTAIRAMQARSERDIHSRLPGIVAAVREVAAADGGLEFVNGGGTGSLARTAAAGIVTELTAGSGFYAPALFDNYRSLELEPAAFFCLPVVRRPVGRRGDPARWRLPGLRAGDARPAARALPSWRPALRPPGGRRRGAEPAARRRGLRAPSRRPGLPAPREGGRALRALRPPGAGRRRGDRRRGPHISRRGKGVSLMARIDLDKSLTAPIDEVFELLTDHASYTRFRGFKTAELLREGTPDRNGVGALRRLVAGPLSFTEEITAFERPTRMDYVIREVNIPLEHDGGSIVLLQDGGGTRVHWTSVFTMPIPVVGGATGAGLAVAIRRGFVRLLDDIDRLA